MIISPAARLVIFAWGNPSRGDDALGPLLLERLETRYSGNPALTFITDFQLQVEHAEDLKEQDLALFIDASVSCSPPFQFQRVFPARDLTYTTHAMHPVAVLEVYRHIYRAEPPPAFLFTVRGEQFELGEPLSPAAQIYQETAWRRLVELCAQPALEKWEKSINPNNSEK